MGRSQAPLGSFARSRLGLTPVRDGAGQIRAIGAVAPHRAITRPTKLHPRRATESRGERRTWRFGPVFAATAELRRTGVQSRFASRLTADQDIVAQISAEFEVTRTRRGVRLEVDIGKRPGLRSSGSS